MNVDIKKIYHNANLTLESIERWAFRLDCNDFVAKDNHYLFGALAWEALRSEGIANIKEVLNSSSELKLWTKGLLKSRNWKRPFILLDKLWEADVSPGKKASYVVCASAILLEILPKNFILPIESDLVLIILSQIYREIRFRNYNRGTELVAHHQLKNGELGRWLPFLKGVILHPNYTIPGKPDVLRGFFALHEFAHHSVLWRPPKLQGLGLTHFNCWMTANEGLAVTIGHVASHQILSRVPHPSLYRIFNRHPVYHGYHVRELVTLADEKDYCLALGDSVTTGFKNLQTPILQGKSPSSEVLQNAFADLSTAKRYVHGSIKDWPLYCVGQRSILIEKLMPINMQAGKMSSMAEITILKDLFDHPTVLSEKDHIQNRKKLRQLIMQWKLVEMMDLVKCKTAVQVNKVDMRLLESFYQKHKRQLNRKGIRSESLGIHPAWTFPQNTNQYASLIR